MLVRAEVDGLPAKYRSLVQYTYIEGKTNEQVARLLQCPVGTVKGRLSRARNLLRARLSQRGWDADLIRYRWGLLTQPERSGRGSKAPPRATVEARPSQLSRTVA